MAKNGDVLADPRKNRVIICEDMDFLWDEPDLLVIVGMWGEGATIEEIAWRFERDPDETLFAIVHLAREGKIGKARTRRDSDGKSIWHDWKENAQKNGISMQSFYMRMKRGMTPEEAATKKLKKGRKGKTNE